MMCYGKAKKVGARRLGGVTGNVERILAAISLEEIFPVLLPHPRRPDQKVSPYPLRIAPDFTLLGRTMQIGAGFCVLINVPYV
jgi:hypothetical protein